MEAVELSIKTDGVVFRVFGFQAPVLRLAPPLVLFHGFTGSAAVWQELAYAWSAKRTVYALDLPGHGGTSLPSNHSWDGHIAALGNLIRKLEDGPVHLLGYSMGARLALGLAAAKVAPLHSLTLESVHPGLATDAERIERRAQDQRWIDLLQSEGVEAFADTWEKLPLWGNQDAGSHRAGIQRSIRRMQRADGLSESLRRVGLAEQPSLRNSLAELALPVHLIAGEKDTRFARLAEEMHPRIPSARRTLVPHAGHSVNIEAAKAYLAATESFFDATAYTSSLRRQHVDRKICP